MDRKGLFAFDEHCLILNITADAGKGESTGIIVIFQKL